MSANSYKLKIDNNLKRILYSDEGKEILHDYISSNKLFLKISTYNRPNISDNDSLHFYIGNYDFELRTADEPVGKTESFGDKRYYNYIIVDDYLHINDLFQIDILSFINIELISLYREKKLNKLLI